MAKKVQRLFTPDLLRKPLFWLLIITLLGGFFRFYNLDWDLKHSFHPDERNILGQTSGIQPGAGYRVTFFAYGQLSVYLYRATGELVSTPQFLFDAFHGNESLVRYLYLFFLAGLFGFFARYFIANLSKILNFEISSLPVVFLGLVDLLVFGVQTFWLHSYPDWVEGFYWFFLAHLFMGSFWFFSREKYKLSAFGTSAFLLLLALFIKFNPNQFTRLDIFRSWFGALEGQRIALGFGSVEIPILPLVGFLFTLVAAFGISLLAAYFLEIEWVGLPFYLACGAGMVLGVLPGFLPDAYHFPREIAALSFAMVVVAGGLWFAWASRWGRVVVAVLALWVYFASRLHGGNQYTGYGECMLIGRWWAALFSTLTIGFIYLFVHKTYKNTTMALVAAASFAFAVVSIEQTHYCITESLITLMCVVVAYCSSEIFREQGSWKSYLLAGAAFGISMATKTSSLFYILIILVGHLALLAQRSSRDWEKDDKKEKNNRTLYSVLTGGLLAVILVGFVVVGLKFRGVVQDLVSMNLPLAAKIGWGLFLLSSLAGIVFSLWGILEFKVLRAQMPQWIKLASAFGLSAFLFCLLSPWSLLDYSGFMISQQYEWHVVSIADACYVLQFKDTPRYLYHLWNLMSVELWWPLGITVVLGMVWVLARFAAKLVAPVKAGYLFPVPFIRGKGFKFSLADLILLGWFVAYFGFIGSWNTKFIRYMVPLIPAFCIFGARFLTDIFDWMKNRFAFAKHAKAAILTVVLGSSLFYSTAYMHIYANPHTWIESSVWIFKNIAQGASIATEAWDDGLPTGVDHQMDPRVEGTMGPQNYKHVDCTPYEMHGFPTDDSPVKKNYYINFISQPEYISIASKKLWYTLTDSTPEFRPHGFNVYPVTSRYYRALWSGLLGFKMVAEFHSFPKLFGWEHPDDMAEESFSVYDHPHVYLFKRFETVPPERVAKLLDSDVFVKGIDRDRMREITPANVDAFIAERHKYLEDSGLLKQLDDASPVTAAALPHAADKPPPARPVKPFLRKAAVSPVPTQPTPEIVIDPPSTVPGLPEAKTLQVLKDYSEHPVIEENLAAVPVAPEEKVSYQLRAWLTWLLLLIVLGLLALPLTLKVFAPLSSGAYSLSKILGFFLYAWVVWFLTSVHLCRFTVGSCWALLLLLGGLSYYFFRKDQKNIKALYSKWGRSWMIQEGAFTLAFFLFTLVRIYNPNIHDPIGEGYNGGGEAGMDFGFLASVVRSETFPPQNMWMAGLPIGYTFYYGHLMMGILTKTLGLVPAVTYNLGLITLFATIFSGAFGLAYALSGRLLSGWIAGFLCAMAGNPDGAKQYLEAIHQCFVSVSLSPLTSHIYDFWGPTRVIPPLSINEFPYFSVLFGDMHAHTLAMPFAMLLIGILASFYSAIGIQRLNFQKDLPVLLLAGFLLGGIAFLNTWEVPTWLVLAGIVLLVRHLAKLNGKSLAKALALSFGGVVVALTLLGWWLTWRPAANPHAVGGSTGLLALFGTAGFAGTALFMLFQKNTNAVSRQLLSAAIGLGIILAATGLLWVPFFINFHPQQSTILWVLPTIRTSVRNYFNVYGGFLVVVLMSFTAVYARQIQSWIGKSVKRKGRGEPLIEKVIAGLESFAAPRSVVQGMMTLGVFSLAVIWGASWAHWTEPQDKMVYSRMFATAAVVFLIVAHFLKNRFEAWIPVIVTVLAWLGLLVTQHLQLVRDMPPTLDLILFSALWLLAFFHLGLAIKVFKDRGLSFAYLLVSFFFFVTAALEIFAMSEYFGFGEGMRNNSLFKYGINAWTLASIAAGVFLPKVFDFMKGLLDAPLKESKSSRRLLLACAGFFLFVLLWALLNVFFPFMRTAVIFGLDIVMLLVILAWGIFEKWFKSFIARGSFIVTGSILVVFSILALMPQGYGRGFEILQNGLTTLDVEVIFPVCLSWIAVGLGNMLLEGRKDAGRRMAVISWVSLFLVLGAMVSIYPFAASVRKCHGFLNTFRRQWGGFVADPTLNGLSYLRRANQPDDAAIRFLNERIPGQPCLVEFVGAGYNTWGSRFSIFTGIPALMGWDGHVGEWVGARLGDDIRNRVNAVEKIFQMTDAVAAKKMLDAYGVRLVMVGTVERNGAAEKPGYPAEGLAKFGGFLPLIYKNPQVEIYYNPPPVK